MMEMEMEMEMEMRGERELSAGYKLVPWSSWEQWNFVRQNIFSSSSQSVSAALQRISAWRSRGCLPIPIDVTAAFVLIQQKDPFFRNGPAADHISISEEMLAMLYSMAIMRLVNGFMENAHKKTGRSISELAEDVGIPRVLVDIRHESSHRDLPSLRLVRSASVKAIDWLKANYWEPQKNAISDVFVEIRSKVRALLYYIKTAETKQTLKKTKVKSFDKLISKAAKAICKLYLAYPSEVVSVLLEFFKMDDPDFSTSADEQLVNYDRDGLKPLFISFNDMKTIITKLSNKEPRLVLSMLKAVIAMIEAQQSLKVVSSHNEKTKSRCEGPLTCNLSSLLLWLITTLKVFQESGKMSIVSEAALPSSDKNSVPVFSLSKLLEKCLSLTIFGEKNFMNSALVLVDMVGDDTVKDKLKKLFLLGSLSWSTEEVALSSHETASSEHENAIKNATKKFEYLKVKSKKHCKNNSDQGDNNAWSVAKSWTPCPIGMVPCSYSSTAVLPFLYLDTTTAVLDAKETATAVLDVKETTTLINVKRTTRENEEPLNHEKQHKMNKTQHSDEPVENPRAQKKRRGLLHNGEAELQEVKHPMKGMLLVGGVWKKVSEEELAVLQSGITTLGRADIVQLQN